MPSLTYDKVLTFDNPRKFSVSDLRNAHFRYFTFRPLLAQNPAVNVILFSVNLRLLVPHTAKFSECDTF